MDVGVDKSVQVPADDFLFLAGRHIGRNEVIPGH